MLLKKCDEATQSIDVPSLESIDSEVRLYFQQQNDDWSPTLSDSDETNELVSTLACVIAAIVCLFIFKEKSVLCELIRHCAFINLRRISQPVRFFTL